MGRGGSFSFRRPCLLFPIFYVAWPCAQSLRATAQEGDWRCVTPPFGQCHCAIEMRGVIPLEKPVIPLDSLPLYDGTASWGGEVLFRFAPIVFFSLYSMLLGAVRSNCVQLHRRGIGALCAEFRRCIGLSTPPRRMPAWVASGSLRGGKKRGGNCTETGRFLHRLPPFAFESGARRVSSNRVVVVRGRAQTMPAANETNAEQKRNL